MPRSYKISWNLKLAEKLEDAVDDAVRDNSTIILKKPFYRKSLDEWDDLNVDIMPPPPAAAKTLPPGPAPHLQPVQQEYLTPAAPALAGERLMLVFSAIMERQKRGSCYG